MHFHYSFNISRKKSKLHIERSIVHKYFTLEQKLLPKTKNFLKSIKRKPPANLDELVHEEHEKAFEKINCLECANCCKSLGPGVKDKDIDRLAKYLRKRPAEVVEEFFELDKDGDYIFRSMPCPFLMDDNYCAVYEARPKACREYPHTDRRRFHQLIPLTQRNISVCPAVWHIVEELRLKLDN